MFLKTVVFALFVVVGVFADTNELPPMRYARNMCKRVKADDKVEEVATAIKTFKNCTAELGDLDQLKEDFLEALLNGTAAATAVLKKYTAKAPELKTCAHALADGVKPCLDNGEKELLTFFKNATDQIIDFASYNDGERVAIFFSEQGPQCYDENELDIQTCTFDHSASPANAVDPVVGPSLSVRCSYYDAMYTCTMNAMNNCTNSIPVRNLVKSLYTTLRKSSPCNDALPVTTLSTED